MEIYVVTIGRGITLNPLEVNDLMTSDEFCDWPWIGHDFEFHDLAARRKNYYTDVYQCEMDFYDSTKETYRSLILKNIDQDKDCIFFTIDELDLDIIREIYQVLEVQPKLSVLVITGYDYQKNKYRYSTIPYNEYSMPVNMYGQEELNRVFGATLLPAQTILSNSRQKRKEKL